MDVQRRGSGDDRAVRDRHAEVDSPVRALLVVVPDVAEKDSFEVTVAQNEQPVETFCPHRPHPALRVRVGPRRSDRCLDYPDALRAEHLVEAGGELGVPVPDEELDRATAVGEIADQVAGLWVPKTSSRPIDLDFQWRSANDEDGGWRSPSSTLPSSVSSSWPASHGVANRTWPSRSSCSATRSPSCEDRWHVRHLCP